MGRPPPRLPCPHAMSFPPACSLPAPYQGFRLASVLRRTPLRCDGSVRRLRGVSVRAGKGGLTRQTRVWNGRCGRRPSDREGLSRHGRWRYRHGSRGQSIYASRKPPARYNATRTAVAPLAAIAGTSCAEAVRLLGLRAIPMPSTLADFKGQREAHAEPVPADLRQVAPADPPLLRGGAPPTPACSSMSRAVTAVWKRSCRQTRGSGARSPRERGMPAEAAASGTSAGGRTSPLLLPSASQSAYFLLIFQITPVPGICTSGPSPSTLNLLSGSDWPKSRTAP